MEGALQIAQKRRQPAQIVAFGRLDSDHIVAQLSQEPAGVGHRQPTHLDDASH
jgi:hypothetical protein